MKRDELIEHWLKSAEEDNKVSEQMYELGNYSWSLYISHLSCEKTFKALWTSKLNSNPIKTHNLILLANKLEISIDDEERIFLNEVNSFNIEAKYPTTKRKLEIKSNKEYTRKFLNKIQEFNNWLKSQIEF